MPIAAESHVVAALLGVDREYYGILSLIIGVLDVGLTPRINGTFKQFSGDGVMTIAMTPATT